MIAACKHQNSSKFGKTRKGAQRFRCNDCGKTYSEANSSTAPLGKMRIDLDKACTALNLLLEGMSLRATSRMTGLSRNTLGDLLLIVGERCETFSRAMIKDVEATDVQADEIWSFVGMKEKTRKRIGASEDMGDSWTWIAIERDTKLVLAYHVGQRDGDDCQDFMNKLKRAITGRFQMTTDGLGAYQSTVPFTFRSNVDFAMLIKTYQSAQNETRYSPANIVAIEKKVMFGSPDEQQICTSHVERLNLTLRMQMRRFARLTNGFSKALDHHRAMQSLFFCWYNFVRPHQSLRTEDGKKQTPAMASGLTGGILKLQEILEVVARSEDKSNQHTG